MVRALSTERSFTHVYSLDNLAALERGTPVFVHDLGRTIYGGIYNGTAQFLAHEFAPEAVLIDSIPLDDLQPDSDGKIRLRKNCNFTSSRVSRGDNFMKYHELSRLLSECREMAA